MDNNDYEGAILSGYHLPDPIEQREAMYERHFWAHIDHCADCQAGPYCAKLTEILEAHGRNPADAK